MAWSYLRTRTELVVRWWSRSTRASTVTRVDCCQWPVKARAWSGSGWWWDHSICLCQLPSHVVKGKAVDCVPVCVISLRSGASIAHVSTVTGISMTESNTCSGHPADLSHCRRHGTLEFVSAWLTAATHGTNANRFVGSTSMKWDENRRSSCVHTGEPETHPSGPMDSTQLRADRGSGRSQQLAQRAGNRARNGGLF